MKSWIQIGMISVSLCVIAVKGCDYLSSKQAHRDQDSPQTTALPRKTDIVESSAKLSPKNSLAGKRMELGALAKVDLAAAIRSLNEIKNSSKQSTVRMEICDQLRELSSEEAEKLIHETQWSHPLEGPEIMFLSLLLENWSKSTPEAVWEWIGKHDIQQKDYATLKNSILPKLIQNLWKQNPDKAMEIMNGLREDPVFQQTVFSLASAMAESDFHHAIAFARNMDGEGGYNMCLSKVMDAYVHAHPEEAMAEFRKIEDANAKTVLSEAIARQLAEIDPKNAYEFASQLPEGTGGSSIYEVAQKWAFTDPQGMADYLKDLPPKEELTTPFQLLITGLTRQDPEAAAKWFTSQAIASYSSSASKPESVPSYLSSGGFDICTSLYEIDPDKGRKWVNELDAGSLRDNIIINLIINHKEEDPQKGMELARSIQNQGIRMDAQRQMIKNAFAGDPDKVKQLMNSMNIPQQEQAEILQSSAR